LRDPELVGQADVLLVESTYGDRVHPDDPTDAFARIVTETAERRSVPARSGVRGRAHAGIALRYS